MFLHSNLVKILFSENKQNYSNIKIIIEFFIKLHD